MDYLHIKKQIVKIILKFHDIICHFDKFNHTAVIQRLLVTRNGNYDERQISRSSTSHGIVYKHELNGWAALDRRNTFDSFSSPFKCPLARPC